MSQLFENAFVFALVPTSQFCHTLYQIHSVPAHTVYCYFLRRDGMYTGSMTLPSLSSSLLPTAYSLAVHRELGCLEGSLQGSRARRTAKALLPSLFLSWLTPRRLIPCENLRSHSFLEVRRVWWVRLMRKVKICFSFQHLLMSILFIATAVPSRMFFMCGMWVYHHLCRQHILKTQLLWDKLVWGLVFFLIYKVNASLGNT